MGANRNWAAEAPVDLGVHPTHLPLAHPPGQDVPGDFIFSPEQKNGFNWAL